MIEVLGITVDRRLKGRSSKMERWAIEKIGYVSILIRKIERKEEK